MYGKRTRDIVGNTHTVKVKREEWIVVDDVYEGIVTQEEFDAAQESLREFVEVGGKKHNRPLGRKVCCGVCGHVMTRSNSKATYYYCQSRRVTDAYSCPTEPFYENDILDVLTEGLRIRALAAVELSRLWEERHRKKGKSAESIRKGIMALSDTLAKQKQGAKDLYEAFVSGKLGKDEYLAAKAEALSACEGTSARIAELEAELANVGADGEMDNPFADRFCQYAAVEEITAEITEDVLDKVIVYPDGRLEVVWKYQSEFQNLLTELYGGEEHERNESMAVRSHGSS